MLQACPLNYRKLFCFPPGVGGIFYFILEQPPRGGDRVQGFVFSEELLYPGKNSFGGGTFVFHRAVFFGHSPPANRDGQNLRVAVQEETGSGQHGAVLGPC